VDGGGFMATYLFPGAEFALVAHEDGSSRYGAPVAEGTPAQLTAATQRLHAAIVRAAPSYTRIPLQGGGVMWVECEIAGRGNRISVASSTQSAVNSVLLSVLTASTPCPAAQTPTMAPTRETQMGGRSPGVSPTPSARGFAIPVLNANIKSLLFYETSEVTTPKEQRRYSVSFPAAPTRYIGIEVFLEHAAPGRVVSLVLPCTIYASDGSVITTLQVGGAVQPGLSNTWHTHSWGNSVAGSWKPGRYIVGCTHNDAVVASGSFSVH
jgi:hypothetical protein